MVAPMIPAGPGKGHARYHLKVSAYQLHCGQGVVLVHKVSTVAQPRGQAPGLVHYTPVPAHTQASVDNRERAGRHICLWQRFL